MRLSQFVRCFVMASCMFQIALTEATSPLNMSRFAAIVQSAVFDAVNGIERRYTPFRVQPNAPPGASRAAAAVQAPQDEPCAHLTG